MSKKKQIIKRFSRIATIEDVGKILREARTVCVRIRELDLQSARRLHEQLDDVVKFCGRLYENEAKTAKRYKIRLKERIQEIERMLASLDQSDRSDKKAVGPVDQAEDDFLATDENPPPLEEPDVLRPAA